MRHIYPIIRILVAAAIFLLLVQLPEPHRHRLPPTVPREECKLCNDDNYPYLGWSANNNIAIVRLNTFQVFPLMINPAGFYENERKNRINGSGQMTWHRAAESSTVLVNIWADRAMGYGSIYPEYNLDLEAVGGHLCQACMEQIVCLLQCAKGRADIAFCNLDTREIAVAVPNLRVWLGDFLVICVGKEARIDFDICYLPDRSAPGPYQS